MGWVRLVFPFKTNHEAKNGLSYEKKYVQRGFLEYGGGFPSGFLKKLQTNFGIEINLLPLQKVFIQAKPARLTVVPH